MKILGLVGASGTGKSTIAAHLAARGAGLVDADRLGHDLLDDALVARVLRERFGEDVFSGARVDRRKLGRLVFGDRGALEALNAVVHPRILDECRRMLADLELRGFALAVVDAALLLEVDVPFRLDRVVALRAPRDVQIERLLAKGGASLAEISARLEGQSELERSFERADAVIDTDRPLSEVLAEIDRLVDGLLSDESGAGNL